MKTIERSNIISDLAWNTSKNTHCNEAYGYSCSFPETWKIDTSIAHNWTAYFVGGHMEITIFTHTNRTNITEYITSILALYGPTTALLEQSYTTIGQNKATRLQMVTTSNEQATYSMHYVINVRQNVLLISINVEDRYMSEMTQKRLEHVLNSFRFDY